MTLQSGAPRSEDERMSQLLIDAAARCIVQRGSARIRMGDVAVEAGVARSTLYRYFPSRDDLIVGLFLTRVDAALEAVIAALPDRDRAAASLPDLIVRTHALIKGSPLNEALWSADSRDLVTQLETRSERYLQAVHRHFAPLLEEWAASGQLHPDLDVPEAVRWINTVATTLLNPPWLELSAADREAFLVKYLVRALVRPASW